MSYTSDSVVKMKAKATAGFKNTQKLIRKLGQMQWQKLDSLMENKHEEEFENINCLECANCCKSISPAMSSSDVRRMAASLKLSVPIFVDKYVFLDEEEDYVFKQKPCPFLGEDNYCSIYDSRPKACREYPHTNRKRFYQIMDLTAKNSKICPAVFNILDKILNEKN